MRLIFLLCLCVSSTSYSKQYFSLGLSENDWFKQSSESKYQLDYSQYQHFQYGFSEAIIPALLVDLSLDKDKDVTAFSISYYWKEHFFQVDQGTISGTIDDGSDGTFFNQYQQILILEKTFKNYEYLLGTGYRKSKIPHKFSYGSSTLQDDALSITTFGIGLYNDPIYNYVHGDQMGEQKRSYFAVSAVFGLSQAVSSDASALSSNNADGEKWFLFGAQGNYEIGYFYGYKNQDYSLAANLGYQVQSDILVSGRPFDLLDSSNNQLNLSSLKRFTHGPIARISYAF